MAWIRSRKKVSSGGIPYVAASQYDNGVTGFYSNITSANAPSGTVAIVYQKVNLTNISNIKFISKSASASTRTSNPQKFGATLALPETWADVISGAYSNINATVNMDVSSLSGEYYVWYAGSLEYNQSGSVSAFVSFEYS